MVRHWPVIEPVRGMRPPWILLALIVITLPLPGVADKTANSPGQKIWALRINDLLVEPPGWTAASHHEIQDIAFSPDNNRLALTIQHVQQVSERNFLWNTHLLILDTQSPRTNVRQFDLSGTCGVDLSWNQSGDTLLVCGTLVRLADGSTRVVSPSPLPSVSRHYSVNKAFWLDAEHVVRPSGTILDVACREVGCWPVPAQWRIGAVTVQKGWVFMWHSEGQFPKVVSEVAIVDRDSHLPLSGWPHRKLTFVANMTFAVGAGMFCSTIAEAQQLTKPRLHCWAVNGGTETELPGELTRYSLGGSAISSFRVVAEKWKHDRFEWLGESPALPRVRAVVDLHSGKVITSWEPRIQNSNSPTVQDWPYHCALSSTGEFIAEAGDGSMEFYHVAP
jgi:hypothetical protein